MFREFRHHKDFTKIHNRVCTKKIHNGVCTKEKDLNLLANLLWDLNIKVMYMTFNHLYMSSTLIDPTK